MTTDYSPYGQAGTLTHSLATRVRWLRGRCLLRRDNSEIREHVRPSGVIVPDRTLYSEHAERDVTIHRGKVLAIGLPARMGDHGPLVPWGIEVGDVVIYTYGVAMQKTRTFAGDEGGELVVVAQEEVIGVVVP
jgi:co-chaperonin GroES (HSP10)